MKNVYKIGFLTLLALITLTSCEGFHMSGKVVSPLSDDPTSFEFRYEELESGNEEIISWES